MNPTFNGCTLIISDKNLNMSEVSIGDIVILNITGVEVFQNSNLNKLAHRVVNIKDGKIATRGDNDDIYIYETQIDGYFEYERVLGVEKYYYNLPRKICRLD